MEGNFESGGMNSGSSMGGGQVGSGFDSGAEMSFEATQPSPSLNSGGMTWEGYLRDGVDNGFYKVDEEGVFGLEDVMMDAQNEMSRDETGAEEPEWDFMNIPGTAHEKLSTFSEMSDEEIDEADEANKNATNAVNDKTNSEESFTEPEKEGLTFEQKIIQIQAETLKLIAESMGKEVNKKELEELMKKLKEIIKEAEGEKNSTKTKMLTGVFWSAILLSKIAEEGVNRFENEVKEVEK